ncbi:MAG: hypothetical protein DRQ47_10150 [Gammaproteobacteria bacterium]|nr:MAG: hypothetical protein DRQ47_10150 [Gammaproteobacteria bacterium]
MAMMAAMSEYETDIADMNRAQLWDGKTSANARMSPPYARSTKKRKIRKGQPTNRVTLKDVGDFHASITAKAEPNALVLGSKRTVKGFDLAGWLDERYYKQGSIYGITPVNRRIILKQTRPLFIKSIKKQL